MTQSLIMSQEPRLKNPKIKLFNELRTGTSGYKSLISFFHEAKKHNGKTIEVDISELKWFEGNLSALFLAIAYHLNNVYNVKLFFPEKKLPEKLSILKRNGLIDKINLGLDAPCPIDRRASAVQVASFNYDDVDSFNHYIENDLLGHRGLDSMDSNDKGKIESSYYEIFDNAGTHGTKECPIFACGQYFPRNNELKFSLVDLGRGFLENIRVYTNGKVNTSEEAIQWALSGKNSTKENSVGGYGLPDILLYCLQNNGIIHIGTGNCYYKVKKSGIKSTILKESIIGTTINLTFRCK